MTDGLKRDRAALQALRATINRNGFGKSRIQSGKLGNMGIRASQLPPQLADMDKLSWLDLSGNGFSGTLPEYWGTRLSFVSLQCLNLQDNSLAGTLPRWNQRGAWPMLTLLNLQGNNFYGPLPTSWAGPNTPLRKLITLDLSFNFLGRDGSISSNKYLPLPQGDSDWGTASAAASGNPFPSLKTLDLSENCFNGSLPAKWGAQYAFSMLQTLDLRYNRFTGLLPDSWGNGKAFPKLLNLYLSGNDLGDLDSPGGLPLTWTSVKVPRSFPALQKMMLYPGNDFLCTWGNGQTQYKARYSVVDDSGVEYGQAARNMQLCPEPPDDNPPTSPSLTKPASVLVLSWKAPATYAGFFCGFQASLTSGGSTLLPATNYVVRPEQQAPLTYNSAAKTYSVASTLVPATGATYTMHVSTLYCDGYTSSEVIDDLTL
ncbi:hypothetical protein N2152v2_002749 [Parachlorella kessleri]